MLINKLNEGQKSGDENGWILHEDIRAYVKGKLNE